MTLHIYFGYLINITHFLVL